MSSNKTMPEISADNYLAAEFKLLSQFDIPVLSKTHFFKVYCPKCGGVTLKEYQEESQKESQKLLRCPNQKCDLSFKPVLIPIDPETGKVKRDENQFGEKQQIAPPFSLAVCLPKVQQDWSGDWKGKPFSVLFDKWKGEADRWYAVTPGNVNVASQAKPEGDSIVFILSGIGGEHKDVFTKESLSRLAIEGVLCENKDTAKITELCRVHYDFISPSVSKLQFKKP
ncbi:hypothetical protein FACS189419_06930 [Planctomycetales bacterium]|nr:hypothetical protein FACS189419_06930 [Planctomycetales bacterium]